MDEYVYTYDSAKNQLTKIETINGLLKDMTTNTFDDLNRLETVLEPSGRLTEYTFDLAGNRETQTVKETVNDTQVVTIDTYIYNPQNRLHKITTTVDSVTTKMIEYIYDNNGNQKTVTTTDVGTGTTQTVQNEYDVFNQLVSTTTNDGTIITNGYNGEGLRVSKTVNGQTTYFLYEYDKVVLEVDGNGNQLARNVYGTNLVFRAVGLDEYYYMYNGHADVTALLDVETGEVVASYYYDAFGNILEQTGNANNSILYSGYQYDEESGLYYLNARHYDPVTARFLQEDTYRGEPNDPLSLNLYTYCANNRVPIKGT